MTQFEREAQHNLNRSKRVILECQAQLEKCDDATQIEKIMKAIRWNKDNILFNEILLKTK